LKLQNFKNHQATRDNCRLFLGACVDIVLLLKAAVMGVVEGLTEFLPISSTGHLILAGALLGLDDDKAKVFDIAIQTGAIFAVIIVYWQKIASTVVALPSQHEARRFALNVFIAFLPAVVLGLLFGKFIKAHLFTPTVVASTFILGGFIILWAEGWGRRNTEEAQDAHPNDNARIVNVESMSPLDALKVGLVQCLAMIPGTSRSGATIIGGMLLGLSRKAATDFSFYLAIPTLIGAGAYSLYKERALLSLADAPVFAVGLVLSFISAWICVRWLLRYIASHSFIPFAWYRIVFGIVVLATAWTGTVTWAA
jgi:undecaprenyl-diphosphatase